MKFDTAWNPNEWTLDDSVPLKIYSNNDEYIGELPLNIKELENLYEAIQKTFLSIKKWKHKKSKYLNCKKETNKDGISYG